MPLLVWVPHSAGRPGTGYGIASVSGNASGDASASGRGAGAGKARGCARVDDTRAVVKNIMSPEVFIF